MAGMTAPRFEWSSATDQADWIGPLLPPLGVSRVGSLIPTGFAAYARLLHPAISVGGNVVRWSETATWSGTALVRGSQFHDIALPRHTPSGPPPWEDPPVRLALPEPDATTLVTLLRSHSSTPDACWFCWDTAHPLPDEPDEDPGTAKRPAPQPVRLRAFPATRLFGRDRRAHHARPAGRFRGGTGLEPGPDKGTHGASGVAAGAAVSARHGTGGGSTQHVGADPAPVLASRPVLVRHDRYRARDSLP